MAVGSGAHSFRFILRFESLYTSGEHGCLCSRLLSDDWREGWRSWLHPDSYAHPNSPAGGPGTGFSRTPGFTRYSWSPLPDPNSPAGRFIHLQTEIWALEQQEWNEIARHVEELETSLATQSDKLRESIPDAYLRTLYDRQVGRTKGKYGFAKSLIGTGVDAALLLQKLTSPVGCFDPDRKSTRLNSS